MMAYLVDPRPELRSLHERFDGYARMHVEHACREFGQETARSMERLRWTWLLAENTHIFHAPHRGCFGCLGKDA